MRRLFTVIAVLVLRRLRRVDRVRLTTATSSSSSAAVLRRGRRRRQEDQGRPRDRHRRPQRPRRSTSSPTRASSRPRRQLGVEGRVLTVQGQLGLRPEPLDAGPAEVRPRDRRRLPDGGRDEHRRDEVPGHQVRDHRRRRAPASRASRPTSQGLLFKEQEAGYLAGYMAGPVRSRTTAARRSARSAARRSRRSTTTSPATRPAPRRPTRTIKTLNGYSQDFVDQAKCKEIALNQIQQGAKVVFQVAGQCGLGALDAAKEKGVQGIGVDADQAYLGDQVMTSAEKKVDVAVETAIKAVAGRHVHRAAGTPSFDLKNDGVGIGKTNAEGAEVRRPGRQVAGHDRTGRSRHPGERSDRHPRMDRARDGPSEAPALELTRASPSGSGRSSRTARSTSSCARERSTPCSARTARASRR